MISIYRMATVRFGFTEPNLKYVRGSVLTGSGSVLARPVRFQYGSVLATVRFHAGSVRFHGTEPLCSVRFLARFGFIPCRFSFMEPNLTHFRFGSITTVPFNSTGLSGSSGSLNRFKFGAFDFTRFNFPRVNAELLKFNGLMLIFLNSFSNSGS